MHVFIIDFLAKASITNFEIFPTLATNTVTKRYINVKHFCFEILICFRPYLIIIFFQDFSAFRLNNLHSAHDNILNVAGVLLRPKIQVHQDKRQTHG